MNPSFIRRNWIVFTAAASILAINALRHRRKIDFMGRVAVISGGSRGLGLVMARQLASQGADLVLLARDTEALERAKIQISEAYPECRLLCIPCDISQQDEVKEAIWLAATKMGRLDILINNAGVVTVSPYENTSLEDFDQAMKVHFWGPLYLTQAIVPYLQESGGGRIVNISSIGGKLGVPHLSAYCASKFALTGLSETLRAELRKYNIYVTTVFPGLMRTGSFLRGKFRGQQSKELGWFAVSDSMPLLSMNSERAARKILEACQEGQAEVILTGVAKTAVAARYFLTELTSDLLFIANRFLPNPVEGDSELIEGQFLDSFAKNSILTKLSTRVVEANNEIY